MIEWLCVQGGEGQAAKAKAPDGWDEHLAHWWEHDLNVLFKDAIVLVGVWLAYQFFKLVVIRGMERLSRHTDNDLDDRMRSSDCGPSWMRTSGGNE